MRKFFKLNAAIINTHCFSSGCKNSARMHFKTHVASGTLSPKSATNQGDSLELVNKRNR